MTTDRLPAWAWALASATALSTYLLGLNLPFLGPDEPRYAQVAREMFERGDWITPTLGGFAWFEKPVLLYWLESLSFAIFGVSESAARLGPAICGIGTVLSMWLLGRAIHRDRDYANWLALLSASTLGIVVFSHGASFDIVVTFPLTAALACFFIAEHSTEDSNKAVAHLAMCYFFIGVALLAKGLIGVVFPVATACLYLGFRGRRPTRQLLVSLSWGPLISIAVAATWYVPMYLAHGTRFIDEFIVQHHFQRFTSNKYQHPQPFYFFLWVLPLMALPWSPFIFAALWGWIRRKSMISTQFGEAGKIELFALCWVCVPLVFFSLSGSKLPGYILPAVPGAVLLASLHVYRFVARSRRSQWTIYSIACLVFVASMSLLVTVVPRVAATESVRDLFVAATERGLPNAPVFGLHVVSHSAEFYAAGRLLREPSGQQKKLYSPAELSTEMERAGVREALVMVPDNYAAQLLNYEQFRSNIVGTTGEILLIAVERR